MDDFLSREVESILRNHKREREGQEIHLNYIINAGALIPIYGEGRYDSNNFFFLS